MMSAPLLKILEEYRRYESGKSRAKNIADRLIAFAERHPLDSAAPRLRRMSSGIHKNQELADELFRPIGAFLAEHEDRFEESILNMLYQALALGYDFEMLLAYAYQDWGENSAFSRVRRRILDSIERHVVKRESALVLGSGAGGVVGAIADVFAEVSAVDLALPAQLVARRMLCDRREMAMSLFKREAAISSENDCVDLTLSPPRQAMGSVQLICADASRLPQISGETSVVITQYLMDVVADVHRVTQEIHRVLEQGGLWINFGLPFGRAGEETTVGARGPEELPEFFAEEGFEVMEMDRMSFDLLDRSAVLAAAAQVTEHPLFFVARKSAESDEPRHARLFFDFFSGHDDAVLARVPVLSEDVGFTENEVYGPSGRRTEQKLWISSPASARAVPQQATAVVRGLLDNLGHGLTIGQLATGLDAQSPGAFPLESLVETFRFLSERKIIDLR